MERLTDLLGPDLHGYPRVHVYEVGSALQEGEGLADLSGRHAVDLRELSQGGTRREGVLVRHHLGLTVAVVREDPLQNLRAFIPGKIDVNVWGILTARVEKPLEEEMVTDRIDVSDAQAVRHNGGSG